MSSTMPTTRISCSCCFAVLDKSYEDLEREHAAWVKGLQTNHPLCKRCGVPYRASKRMAQPEIVCACGLHNIQLSDKDAVCYESQIWRLSCLFRKKERRLPKMIQYCEKLESQVDSYHKMRVKFIRMKKLIAGMLCSNCGHPVGNRWRQHGSDLLCGGCANDIGGEG